MTNRKSNKLAANRKKPDGRIYVNPLAGPFQTSVHFLLHFFSPHDEKQRRFCTGRWFFLGEVAFFPGSSAHYSSTTPRRRLGPRRGVERGHFFISPNLRVIYFPRRAVNPVFWWLFAVSHPPSVKGLWWEGANIFPHSSPPSEFP